MDRKEFLRRSLALGLGAPFLGSLLTSCSKEVDLFPDLDVNFSGKVLVIGAGAAGMTAGYILQRYGIDFEILEAHSLHGGRVKKIDNFADVPIDLGAEWIHTDPSILASLLDDPTLNASIETVSYKPDEVAYWDGSGLRRLNAAGNFYGEYKFKTTTWFDYFDQYFVSHFRDKIIYNAPVTEIDYSGARVAVRTADNNLFEADKVLLTVPVSILKQSLIAFTPALPSTKTEALTKVEMPAGFKASLEFSERFYPDIVATDLNGLVGDNDPELFIDGVFRKGSDKHIMNLFTVQKPAEAYSDLSTDEEKRDLMLSKLDEMFEGKASQTLLNWVVQDWTNEPWIRGSYSFYGSDAESVIEVLREPLNGKVFFAGEAYSPENWSTVHGAAQSAYAAVDVMLR